MFRDSSKCVKRVEKEGIPSSLFFLSSPISCSLTVWYKRATECKIVSTRSIVEEKRVAPCKTFGSAKSVMRPEKKMILWNWSESLIKSGWEQNVRRKKEIEEIEKRERAIFDSRAWFYTFIEREEREGERDDSCCCRCFWKNHAGLAFFAFATASDMKWKIPSFIPVSCLPLKSSSFGRWSLFFTALLFVWRCLLIPVKESYIFLDYFLPLFFLFVSWISIQALLSIIPVEKRECSWCNSILHCFLLPRLLVVTWLPFLKSQGMNEWRSQGNKYFLLISQPQPSSASLSSTSFILIENSYTFPAMLLPLSTLEAIQSFSITRRKVWVKQEKWDVISSSYVLRQSKDLWNAWNILLLFTLFFLILKELFF